MATLNENLTRLSDAKADIAQAIENKGVTVPNNSGFEDFSELIDSIETSGSNEVDEKDVNFYDFDGRRIYSYTKEEFLQLSEFPANPTHEGLISLGWNWDFENVYNYVQANGLCDVGQQYTTDDGCTRIHISLPENCLNPYIGLYGSYSVQGYYINATIDWGDNSSAETYEYSSGLHFVGHTYNKPGDYIISIKINGGVWNTAGTWGGLGTWLIQSSDSTTLSDMTRRYRNCITRIDLGANTSGNIPLGVDFMSLESITGFTTLSFSAGYSESGAGKGYAIDTLIVPKGQTSFSLGYPQYEYNPPQLMHRIILSDTITYFDCTNNFSIEKIILPNSITTIYRYCFWNCTKLKTICMGNVTTIYNRAFERCTSLPSLTIPATVTSLPTDSSSSSLRSILTGGNSYNLKFIKFKRSTPVSVSSGYFDFVTAGTIIYVPKGSLSSYTSAANYPSTSTCTYIEY